MKFILMMICLLSVSLTWAKGSAKVVLLIGEASFAGKALTKTSSLQGTGEIVVGNKSYLKLLLSESQTVIALGANTTSRLNISAPAEKQELNLVKGIARWVTGNKKGLGIKTSNATMGVRGTDFYTSYHPLLGETEIVCFEGSVEFTNTNNSTDSKLIKKNQWGGIGGRFGTKVSSILDLSPELIKSFDSALPK